MPRRRTEWQPNIVAYSERVAPAPAVSSTESLAPFHALAFKQDGSEIPIGNCGSAALNDYLRRYARQNHESGGAKTFVAVDASDPARVLGYYAISPGAVEFARVPAQLTRKLGRYEVPIFRLGRLAVSTAVQGRGLGGDLLLAAGERALAVATQIGGVALAIDAKDSGAASWYMRFGAVPLLDDRLKLILPLSTVAETIEAAVKKRS